VKKTRRLAASFETYRVCRAYRTREIPAQSHVRLGVFFRKSPKAAGFQRVKKQQNQPMIQKTLYCKFRKNKCF